LDWNSSKTVNLKKNYSIYSPGEEDREEADWCYIYLNSQFSSSLSTGLPRYVLVNKATTKKHTTATIRIIRNKVVS